MLTPALGNEGTAEHLTTSPDPFRAPCNEREGPGPSGTPHQQTGPPVVGVLAAEVSRTGSPAPLSPAESCLSLSRTESTKFLKSTRFTYVTVS